MAATEEKQEIVTSLHTLNKNQCYVLDKTHAILLKKSMFLNSVPILEHQRQNKINS